MAAGLAVGNLDSRRSADEVMKRSLEGLLGTYAELKAGPLATLKALQKRVMGSKSVDVVVLEQIEQCTQKLRMVCRDEAALLLRLRKEFGLMGHLDRAAGELGRVTRVTIQLMPPPAPSQSQKAKGKNEKCEG